MTLKEKRDYVRAQREVFEKGEVWEDWVWLSLLDRLKSERG
jgi:hypothetical protein